MLERVMFLSDLFSMVMTMAFFSPFTTSTFVGQQMRLYFQRRIARTAEGILFEEGSNSENLWLFW